MLICESNHFSSSSVGLAKAALEAINGFNLFGNQVLLTSFGCLMG